MRSYGLRNICYRATLRIGICRLILVQTSTESVSFGLRGQSLAELARSGAADQALFAALGAAVPAQPLPSATALDRLCAHLIDASLLRPADLERAQLLASQSRTRLPAVLTRLGLVPDRLLAESFSVALGVPLAAQPLIPLAPLPPGLNPRFLGLHNAVPLFTDEAQLVIATSDPSNEALRAGLAFALEREIIVQVAPDASISRALAQMDLDGGSAPEAAANDQGLSLRADMTALEDAGSDAPVVRLVTRLIAEAARRGASDIHIEALPRALIVRFRIDGDLQIAEEHDDGFAAPVVSRIKVMAGLDIAEKRLPQDGRIRTQVEGESLDIRVSTTPTVHGEGVVMRLLGRSHVTLDLDQLGLSDVAVRNLKSALSQPHGIILLTGPTGSGKTTTLYAALERLKSPTTKILTVEDPVEYVIPGVNQVQVKPEIGLTYASALRAFLRQDPDILLVGEIRDKETADIAIRAALTGHLVLSTLHTNSALGAFTRLVDMGVEPFLLASTVRLTAAQRLVRKLCTHCKTPRAILPSEAALFASHDMVAPAHIFEAKGCAHCYHSGTRGRTPVIETVPITTQMAEAVRDNAPEAALAKAAETIDALMRHALELVAEGIIAIDEARQLASDGGAA
jgi:general secretion pathway protein E